jgi:hypothetical protein
MVAQGTNLERELFVQYMRTIFKLKNIQKTKDSIKPNTDMNEILIPG